MNVDALRYADRYLGLPLCHALSLVRFLLRPFQRSVEGHQPQRVLIIKLSEMGSTVIAYPAVAQLHRRLPDASVYALTFSENRAIFDALPTMIPADQVLAVDTSSPWRMLTSGIAAVARLRQLRIDATIDMDFFSRFSAILGYLICPQGRRVGFERYTCEGLSRGNLLTIPVQYSPHIHTAEAFMALTEALFNPHPSEVGLKQYLGGHDYTVPTHVPQAAELESLRRTLRDAGVDPQSTGSRLVLVNPNSSALFPLRKWPAIQFIEFCRRLLEARPDVRIAVTGGRSEREEAERFVLQVGSARCVSFAGRTTFPELLALYTVASLMVTNDSGPAHFAALTPLPVVVLFGPETPRLYGPLGKNARSLYTNYACSPCVSVYNAKKSPCRNNRCLQAITVDDVLHNALELLG